MKVLAFASFRYGDILLQRSKPSGVSSPAKGYSADYYLKLNPLPPPHAEIPFIRLVLQAVDDLGGFLIPPHLSARGRTYIPFNPIQLGPFDLDQDPAMLHENIHSPKSNTKAQFLPGSSNVARTPSEWHLKGLYKQTNVCLHYCFGVFRLVCEWCSTATNIIQTNLIITNRIHPRRPSFTLRSGPGSWKLNVYFQHLSWL